MAILSMKDMRKLGEKDLEKKMDELRLELAKERANISIGATVTSPGRIKEIRKTISRIKSVRKEKSKGGS
jgi:large subunit ribosomal protein L29